jgi:tRNA threonylcarbamoyladenosine biosynthesis protein TsaB
VKILAFDTAFSTCAVGLLSNGQLYADDRYAPMQQSRLILPIISEQLSAANCTPSTLDVIAYGCGPGSFTGVRIAQSVAQGIAFSTEKRLLPISSLAILAQTAFMVHGWESVIVCVDARMGQVHWAEYAVVSGTIMTLAGEERTCMPDEIPEMDKKGWYGIGNGWAAYPALTAKMNEMILPSSAAELEPQARAILALANNIIMTESV